MSSMFFTCSIGPMTEISSSSVVISSARTGKNLGSRNAAEIALDATARHSGSTARIEPMHPRRSPPFVRSVTNAPAGCRRASSKSASLKAGGRPASIDSIDVRASFRSWRRCCSLSTVDEHQVPDIHEESRSLPDDEHCVMLVNRISRGDDSADDRQVPERQRDVALALPLGGDPLHDEARAEK